MKVLFVNPPQTASKYKFMGVIAPPLGIAYMAGVLQENNIDVEISSYLAKKVLEQL